MRACIDVASLNSDGERFDFTQYICSVFDSDELFINYITNKASDIAQESCCKNNLDFIAVIGIGFDHEDEEL